MRNFKLSGKSNVLDIGESVKGVGEVDYIEREGGYWITVTRIETNLLKLGPVTVGTGNQL